MAQGKNPRNWPTRYKLYYDEYFDYSTVTHKHVERCRRLNGYIEYLRLSILSEGLHNPVQVHWRTERPHIHPGKSRVAALKLLGRTTVPAIIVTKEGLYKPTKGVIEISPEDAQSYLSDDCVAEYDHRNFNIKKRPK